MHSLPLQGPPLWHHFSFEQHPIEYKIEHQSWAWCHWHFASCFGQSTGIYPTYRRITWMPNMQSENQHNPQARGYQCCYRISAHSIENILSCKSSSFVNLIIIFLSLEKSYEPMEKTVKVSLFLQFYYYENEKGKLNRVTLTICILKPFFTTVRWKDCYRLFWRSEIGGGLSGEIFLLFLKNNFWN